MSTNETLGQRLQRLRAGLGLSQSRLAAVAGVPFRTLQSWEIGRREPSWRDLVALCRALDVSVESLADTRQVVGKRRAAPKKGKKGGGV